MRARFFVLLGLGVAFAISSSTFVGQSAASVESASLVSTSAAGAQRIFTPIHREATVTPGKVIWMAEYCPCKTPQGECRRDSSGKPADNC